MCVFKTCNAAGVSPPCAVNPFATREVYAIRVLSKSVTCEVRQMNSGNRRNDAKDERGQRWRHRRSRESRSEIRRRIRRHHHANAHELLSNRWRRDVRNPPSAAASYAPTNNRVKLQLQCSLGGAAAGDALEWRKNDHRMEFHTREVRSKIGTGGQEYE